MFKNFFKVLFRNIKRNKVVSFTAIAGLSFGLTTFLLMLSYVQFENNYDNFHENSRNIYRVELLRTNNYGEEKRILIGAPLMPLLKSEFPQIENGVRLTSTLDCMISSKNNSFVEKRFIFADESFFDIFSFPLKSGNKKRLLTEPFTVVITPKISKKYFGNENPIGKTIKFQTKIKKDDYSFRVVGVTENIPANSSIKFDFLASYASVKTIFGKKFLYEHWDSPTINFIELKENENRNDLEKLFPTFAEKYIKDNNYKSINLGLTPLNEVYFSSFGGGINIAGDWGIKPLSYLLLIAAFLVLTISCFNFMNLFTVKSITRAKEIGIRKVHGSSRMQLIFQFMGETIVLSFFAALFSIALIEIILPIFQNFLASSYPTFNVMAKREINFGIMNLKFLSLAFLISLLVGIVSGFYPAIFLSKLKPIKILKGKNSEGEKSAFFQKVLVAAQFIIVIIVMVLSFNIYNYTNKLSSTDLGFTKENIVVIPIYDSNVREKAQTLKTIFNNNTHILGVTFSSKIPGNGDANYFTVKTEDGNYNNTALFFSDEDFLNVLNIKMITGNDSYKNDTKQSFLINESAAKELGIKNFSKQHIELGSFSNDQFEVYFTGKLSGVYKDFKHSILSQTTQPLLLAANPNKYEYILVKTDGTDNKIILNELKKGWESLNFEQKFESTFLTSELEASIAIFSTLNKFVGLVSLITIIITAFGLFTLASFIINNKTKEIGVRKVLGASMKNLIFTLSKSFILLVIVANVIALPIAYKLTEFISRKIPNNFEINIYPFLLTTIFTISITAIIVGVKSFISSKENVIESLRNE